MTQHTPLRALLAVSFLFAVGAGQASARERHDVLTVMRNAAIVAANQSSVHQEGSNNGASVVQNGEGNVAGIRQFGRNNTGAVTQTGANNAACLIQVGRGLDGSIAQIGDNQSTGVIQTRRGARPIPAEVCALDNDRRGFWMGAVRQAVRRVNR